ncbi:MAG: Ku protein [Gallionella sp.]|jgi:DNA end-binding protein Ku|nr:Ku protein [Gallionella sp.]MCK9354721.1 Ku protein [Gallionella sp.]
MDKDDSNQAEEEDLEQEQPHAIWSGIIAFGLVSLPVSLFPAHRGKIALKMVDANGALLKRQFFGENDRQPLERDDIVRSYEIEKYHYVVVEDEELEALEPKKSREIDLKRFVPLSSINPVYFERAYFLVPDSDTTKAYRLLAKSMEDEQRVGIASFVMHGKDYLVAIIAERGILRAETLRFHDELRTPEQVGLPKRQPADKALVERMRAAIGKSMRKRFDGELLSDRHTRDLMQRIEAKLKAGTDVLPAPEEPEAVEAESNVIDLMQVLKERLQGRQVSKQAAGKASKPERSSNRGKPRGK